MVQRHKRVNATGYGFDFHYLIFPSPRSGEEAKRGEAMPSELNGK